VFIREIRGIYTLLDNGDRSAMSIVKIRVIAYDTSIGITYKCNTGVDT
jgi:hypothetical protein